MGKTTVTQKVAEQEFKRFCEMMELDVDTSVMDDEDRTAFEGVKRRLIKAISDGKMTINEKGEPVFTPSSTGETLVFAEPSGETFLTMDKQKKNADVSKMFGMMGQMTGVHASTFTKMPARDLKVCQGIVTLFFG